MLYVSTVYRDFEPAIEYRPLRYLTSFSLIWSKTGSDESWENVNLYFVMEIIDKISAQPHPTLCIQFLNRENNEKQYISIGKTDLFYNSMGLCGNLTKIWLLILSSSCYTFLCKVVTRI